MRGLISGGALVFGLGAGLASVGEARADDGPYFSVSGGLNVLNESNNNGQFTSDFTTGAGTTIPAGTVLASGTGLAWDTEFDLGFAVSGAAGWYFGNGLRTELELAYRNNQVDTHTNFQVGGAGLGTEDAGILITGSGNLDVSVADLIAVGEGEVESFAIMANAIYDFDLGTSVTPYLGGGLGVSFVTVDYRPSGIGIADDTQAVFAYQVLAGLNFEITKQWEIFTGYRFHATQDAEVDLDLVPAQLDVENQNHTAEFGIRFKL